MAHNQHAAAQLPDCSQAFERRVTPCACSSCFSCCQPHLSCSRRRQAQHCLCPRQALLAGSTSQLVPTIQPAPDSIRPAVAPCCTNQCVSLARALRGVASHTIAHAGSPPVLTRERCLMCRRHQLGVQRLRCADGALLAPVVRSVLAVQPCGIPGQQVCAQIAQQITATAMAAGFQQPAALICQFHGSGAVNLGHPAVE